MTESPDSIDLQTDETGPAAATVTEHPFRSLAGFNEEGEEGDEEEQEDEKEGQEDDEEKDEEDTDGDEKEEEQQRRDVLGKVRRPPLPCS